MSKWGNGYDEIGWNTLSDFENVTIPYGSSNPAVMDYDGFLYLYAYGSGAYNVVIYLNGIATSGLSAQGGWSQGACFPVKKGDTVYWSGSAATTFTGRTKYYKKRDYSNQ